MMALTIWLAATAMASVGLISGDFDHDGVRDSARIVEGAGQVSEVVIESGRHHKSVIVDREQFSEPFLELNKYRGRVRTACGKGYDVDCRGVPDEVALKGGELLYGQRESSSFVVVWRDGRFHTIQLSD